MSDDNKLAPTEVQDEEGARREGHGGTAATASASAVQDDPESSRQESPAVPTRTGDPDQAATARTGESSASVLEKDRRIPTSESIRKLIRKVLPTDPKLNAFCIDKYPVVYSQFSEGMNRETKLNIILEASETDAILTKLTEYLPFGIHEHRSIVEYETLPLLLRNQPTATASQTHRFLYDTFLSYNNRDEGFGRSIAELLRRRGFKVWYEADSIAAGEPLEQARLTAIQGSRIIIVLIGENWRSPWQSPSIREQVKATLASSMRKVIPVLLPGAPRTDRPVLLQPLRALDFRQNFEELILAVGESRRIPWRTVARTGAAIVVILSLVPSIVTVVGSDTAKLERRIAQTEASLAQSEEAHQRTQEQLADVQASMKQTEKSREQAEEFLAKVKRAASSGKSPEAALSEVKKLVAAPPTLAPPDRPNGGAKEEPPDGGPNPTSTGPHSLIIKTTPSCFERLHLEPREREFRLLLQRAQCDGNWKPVIYPRSLDVPWYLKDGRYKCTKFNDSVEIHLQSERLTKWWNRLFFDAHFDTLYCNGLIIWKNGAVIIAQRKLPGL